jgi:hypothetical protein
VRPPGDDNWQRSKSDDWHERDGSQISYHMMYIWLYKQEFSLRCNALWNPHLQRTLISLISRADHLNPHRDTPYHLHSIMPLTVERAVPYPAIIPYDKQSVAVPGTKRPGQTGAWYILGDKKWLRNVTNFSALPEW